MKQGRNRFLVGNFGNLQFFDMIPGKGRKGNWRDGFFDFFGSSEIDVVKMS